MKIRFNPLLLGAFITGAVVIVVAVLLGLGPISLFHPTGHFIFYLPRSAQGVGEGTAVSLDGVRVGQVQAVRVFYDANTRNSFVGVICRINKNLLTDLQGRPIRLTERQTFRKLVSEGLYAQVQTSGLVGAKYVELGFNASAAPIALAATPSSPYPVVPSVPSTMSELTGNISHILSNLRQVDFHGIMEQVNGVLVAARQQIGELQTNRLTDRVSAAAESFGNFMNSSDLHGAANRVEAAAANFQELATNLNAQLQPAATNLNATLISARQSAQSLQDFLTLRNQLGEQTQELLGQLNQTARAIEQLSDFLQRHPNALITGRAEAQEIH